MRPAAAALRDRSPPGAGGGCAAGGWGGGGSARQMGTQMAGWRDRLSVVEQMAADAILARLVAGGLDIDAREEEGRTALQLAVNNGNAALARLLLKHGASARLEGAAAAALLCDAVQGIISRNAPEALAVLRRLLEAGAAAAASQADGTTPLLAAACVAPCLAPKHATLLLELLLQHGADAKATDNEVRRQGCCRAQRRDIACMPAAREQRSRARAPAGTEQQVGSSGRGSGTCIS